MTDFLLNYGTTLLDRIGTSPPSGLWSLRSTPTTAGRPTSLQEGKLFIIYTGTSVSVAEPVEQFLGSGSDLPNRLRLQPKRTGSDRLRLRTVVTTLENAIFMVYGKNFTTYRYRYQVTVPFSTQTLSTTFKYRVRYNLF